MVPRLVFLIACLFFMLSFSSALAQASAGDSLAVQIQGKESRKPPVGKDKLMHATASAFLAAGSYFAIRQYTSANKTSAARAGAIVSFNLGLVKELRDLFHPRGRASLRDLIANSAGIAAFLLVVRGSQ